jgi:hypothetical protein
MKTSLVLGLAALVLGGCAEPVVGQWDLDMKGVDAQLELTDDGRGQETLKGRFDATCSSEGGWMEGQATVRVESDVDWTERGDEYRLEWECKSASITGPGPCSVHGCDDVAQVLGVTFEHHADCVLVHDDGELSCENKDGDDFSYTR